MKEHIKQKLIYTSNPSFKKILIYLRWKILQYIFWHNVHKFIGNFILKYFKEALHNTGRDQWVCKVENHECDCVECKVKRLNI